MIATKSYPMAVVLQLFKEFNVKHTVTSLHKNSKISRVGVWNVLKSLEQEQIINLIKVGEGKTSAQIAKLNFDNEVLDNYLIYSMEVEALQYKRWKVKFKSVEAHAEVLLLFGSVLHSYKEAKDIDLLAIKAASAKVANLDKEISNIQKNELKKIHLQVLTEKDFLAEIQKPNSPYIDAIHKGVVLSGEKKYLRMVKKLHFRDYDHA